MKHIPHTSRVFLGLLIISLLLTYIAITLSHYRERLYFNYEPINQVGSKSEPLPQVNTSGWVPYQNNAFPIAFLHPDDWIISTQLTDDDFYNIAINVPGQNQNIHIYVDDTSYYALDGLKREPFSLGQWDGMKIDESIYGIKAGDYFYTFDASMNREYLPEFTTLISTAIFD